ncbi:MAG: dockerin type I repeat-containing protein [Ruminococcus sp.]|nr:dockerin type I repeat-containing protein [Ruminococcus sp.]
MKKIIAVLLAAILILSCMAAAGVSANAATKLDPGYYVVGTFNSWSLDRNYKMSQPDAIERYVLRQTELKAGDELKIVYSADGINKGGWYPGGGPQSNYVVQYDSYYNIEYAINTGYTLSDWDRYLLVEPCDPPTDVPDPTEPEPRNLTKELWESGAELTAADIEEAVNDEYQSRQWIGANEISIYHSYRFDCSPAYEVDFEVEGYGCYACVILERLFGDYFFSSSSSYEPRIFTDNKLYTITKAYEAGILTEDMLAELAASDHSSADIRTSGWFVTRYIKGDADGDGEVSIVDATCIQRHEANIATAAFYKPLADVDGDSDVTVIDATLIQRKEAGLYTIQ